MSHHTAEPDDGTAWLESLYEDVGPSLLGYLTQRAADPELARDLLQETFAVAVRHPERLQRAASARAYLFGVARNLAITAFRRHRDLETLSADVSIDDAPADARLEWMREAIAQLKPEFREALELRLQQELSYEEIAQVLDIPVGTVRSRLHHAVRQLRRALRHADARVVARKDAI